MPRRSCMVNGNGNPQWSKILFQLITNHKMTRHSIIILKYMCGVMSTAERCLRFSSFFFAAFSGSNQLSRGKLLIIINLLASTFNHIPPCLQTSLRIYRRALIFYFSQNSSTILACLLHFSYTVYLETIANWCTSPAESKIIRIYELFAFL